MSTDTSPIDELVGNGNADIVPLPSPPKRFQTTNKLLFLLYGPLKVLLQSWWLFAALAYRIPPSKWMLVQNPPSIPTLAIAALVCRLRGTKLVIDWHNFGYTILALKLGDQHPLVRISYTYEFFFAKLAYAHIAVTDAMSRVLRTRLGKDATLRTLHDRPAPLFQPCDQKQRLAFLQSYDTLAEHYNALATGSAKLLVSSTSWTPDEDFSIFLDALCQFAQSAACDPKALPELVVVITGKGPQKQYYTDTVARLQSQGILDKVHIYTDWLSFRDYAALLAAADLGISLHTSSSGVDLPMKVVDMFGAGLPVLGWGNFAAWPELVTEHVNGRSFKSADEMAACLYELLRTGPSSLPKLKTGALQQSKRRWDHEWDSVMCSLLEIQ
jgi:beta-1,4-mannosyltransferase